MSTSLLSEDQLKQQIRVRLAQGRLAVVPGVYKTNRGNGRPCIVCRRAIEPTDVEYQVDGAGIVLNAHGSCYLLWREESQGLRQVPVCRHCGKAVQVDEPRQREPAGYVHGSCRDADIRRRFR